MTTIAPSTSLVAIAGAGPAGLSLAALLECYHQPYVIIEPKRSIDHLSKATGLHRNTLRLFGRIGLADEIAREAIELNANRMYVDGNLVKTVTFEQGLSSNDKNLSIDQFSLENILLSRLSTPSILFGKKLVNFYQESESVLIDVEDCETSEIEQIRAKYLVGADGAKSLVRRILGSSFDGITTEETAFTFDAISSPPLPENEMAMFTTGEERLVVVPLPKGKYKFSGRIKEMSLVKDRSTESSPEIWQMLSSIVDRRSRLQIDPDTISGLSFYHTASRIASVFRDQRVFLIGDAAHLFFPAGGYGLNVAVEDGFALGWRIALTEAGVAPTSVFNLYEQQRRLNAIAIQADATQKKVSSENPRSEIGDEKEVQVYGDISFPFQPVISERLEAIFPSSLSQTIQKGDLSLFDWIHKHSGFSLIINTHSSSTLTLFQKRCELLNTKSPIPFSLVHICLGACSFPEDSTFCFSIRNVESIRFFEKYPESVISIRPDNFASVTAVHALIDYIDPLLT